MLRVAYRGWCSRELWPCWNYSWPVRYSHYSFLADFGWWGTPLMPVFPWSSWTFPASSEPYTPASTYWCSLISDRFSINFALRDDSSHTGVLPWQAYRLVCWCVLGTFHISVGCSMRRIWTEESVFGYDRSSIRSALLTPEYGFILLAIVIWICWVLCWFSSSECKWFHRWCRKAV